MGLYWDGGKEMETTGIVGFFESFQKVFKGRHCNAAAAAADCRATAFASVFGGTSAS